MGPIAHGILTCDSIIHTISNAEDIRLAAGARPHENLMRSVSFKPAALS